MLVYAPDINSTSNVNPKTNQIFTMQPHSIAFILQLFSSIASSVEVVATESVLSISLFRSMCPNDQIVVIY